MLQQRVIGAVFWVTAYTIAAIVSGLILHTSIWIVSAVGYYSESLQLFMDAPSTPIYFFPVTIYLMAAPAAILVLGVPEFLGIQPNVKIWFILGGFVAAISLLGWLKFFSSGSWTIQGLVRMVSDPGILALVFSGMVAGGVLAALRRNWL